MSDQPENRANRIQQMFEDQEAKRQGITPEALAKKRKADQMIVERLTAEYGHLGEAMIDGLRFAQEMSVMACLSFTEGVANNAQRNNLRPDYMVGFIAAQLMYQLQAGSATEESTNRVKQGMEHGRRCMEISDEVARACGLADSVEMADKVKNNPESIDAIVDGGVVESDRQ
jgi:hypothetical protein